MSKSHYCYSCLTPVRLSNVARVAVEPDSAVCRRHAPPHYLRFPMNQVNDPGIGERQGVAVAPQVFGAKAPVHKGHLSVKPDMWGS